MKSILGPVSLVALATILVFTNASPTPVQVESQMEMAMAFSATDEPICLEMCLREIPRCWEIPPANHWYSVNKGQPDHPCWTCCQAPSVMEIDSSPSTAEMSMSLSQTSQQLCLGWTLSTPPQCWNLPPRNTWYSVNKCDAENPCWDCCRDLPGGEDIKEIEPSTAIAQMTMSLSQTSQQICLGWTLPTPPQCWNLPPRNTWYSVNKCDAENPCWDCCRDLLEDSDVKQIEASVKTHAKATTSDVTVSINVHENKASVDPFCLHVCWPEDQECPYGLEPKQKGSDDDHCLSCCQRSGDENMMRNNIAHKSHNEEGVMTRKKPHKSHKSTTSVSIHPDAEEFSSNTAMCIKKCWVEERPCPYDFKLERRDGCFKCCRYPEDHKDDLILVPKIAHKSHKYATSLSTYLEKGEVFVNHDDNEICLMVCYDNEPECAPEWHPEQMGQCWTCCRPVGL